MSEVKLGTTVVAFCRRTADPKEPHLVIPAIVLGVVGAESHAAGDKPALNLLVSRPGAEAYLGSPDWQNAFSRKAAVLHVSHPDVQDGKESEYYIEAVFEPRHLEVAGTPEVTDVVGEPQNQTSASPSSTTAQPSGSSEPPAAPSEPTSDSVQTTPPSSNSSEAPAASSPSPAKPPSKSELKRQAAAAKKQESASDAPKQDEKNAETASAGS